MSLKSFHIVFISLSCLLALGFGFWCLRNGYPAFGAVSFVTSVALVGYGAWFLRKLKQWDEDAAKRKTSPLSGSRGGHGGGGALAAPDPGM